MHFWKSISRHFAPALAAILATAFIAPPAAALVFADGGVSQIGKTYYGESGFQYLDESSSFNFTPFNYGTGTPDPTVGVGGSFLGVSASVYAQATASISGLASVTNAMTYKWKQDNVTQILGADTNGVSKVGSPFIIGTASKFLLQNMQVGKGDFELNLSGYERVGFGVTSEVCVVTCFDGPSITFGDGQNGHALTLAAYSSASNTVTALGQTYQGALPQTFDDPNKIFSVGIYPPDLNGFRGGTSPDHLSLYTSTTLASANLNVGALVAQTFGIPPQLLKDSISGFDYETFGAYVGAAINLEQSLTMRPFILDKVYHFSGDVERYDEATDTWVNIGNRLSLQPDQYATLRAPDAVNLGVTVENIASFSVETNLTLSAEMHAQLVLMEISGHGLNAHLYDHTFDIAAINNIVNFHDMTYTKADSVYSAPINLSFTPEFECALCQTGGFVTVISLPPSPDPAPDPGESTLPQTNVVYRVLNFGAPGCNNIVTTNCIRDTSRRPVHYVSRLSQTRALQRNAAGTNGDDSVDYSADGFDEFDALDLQADTVAMTPEQLHAANLAMLAAVYPNGVRPNLSLSAAVPEPASWALMIGGFGLMGGAARRRRAVLA